MILVQAAFSTSCKVQQNLNCGQNFVTLVHVSRENWLQINGLEHLKALMCSTLELTLAVDRNGFANAAQVSHETLWLK